MEKNEIEKSEKIVLLKSESPTHPIEKLDEEEEDLHSTENKFKTQKKIRRVKKQAVFAYSIICCIACCLITVFLFIGVTFLVRFLVTRIPGNPLERAKYLAERTPLVDGHNDIAERVNSFIEKGIPISIHLDRDLSSKEIKILESYNTTLNTDIPRMREGKVGAQFWAVYVNCKAYTSEESVFKAFDSFRTIQDMIKVYDKDFQQVFSSSDLEGVFKSGKIASLIGVEGGQMINSSISILREWYRLGTRYMTLTHNCNTRWCDSCCDPAGHIHNGLTEFGISVVKEMNRIGMIVDISHVSVQAMIDVIEHSEAPVMFSHSNAYALCKRFVNHLFSLSICSPRNVPDNVLEMLKQNNGIIMVTFCCPFVSEEERIIQANYSEIYHGVEYYNKVRQWEDEHPNERASINKVADHIDHIKNLIGWEHLGIGSDFDGISFTPLGLSDSSRYMYLIEELIKRDYKDEEIKGILGNNFLRVLRDAESRADSLGIDSIFEL